jgi:glucose-1-phosphate adenylyltransferase
MKCPEGARNEICNSLVANGCTLCGARLTRSILSPKVKVYDDCQIQDTVLLEGVEVGRGARIRNAVVDKHVRIPPGAIIGYDLDADRRRYETTAGGVVVLSGNPFPELEERAGRRIEQPHLPMFFSETRQSVRTY